MIWPIYNDLESRSSRHQYKITHAIMMTSDKIFKISLNANYSILTVLERDRANKKNLGVRAK